jgi:hypothetical protein
LVGQYDEEGTGEEVEHDEELEEVVEHGGEEPKAAAEVACRATFEEAVLSKGRLHPTPPPPRTGAPKVSQEALAALMEVAAGSVEEGVGFAEEAAPPVALEELH